ncbi:MAG: LD-carboxypeptidase [Sandaracinaceae bacterium]|nr:LD-carboxypeptidase [Sandaracinaceae bacterium]
MRVIAPASPFPRADFERGVARLRERYTVELDPSIFDADGYLAGGDARRLDELRRALTDGGVDAVVAARGGYGATRLLDGIAPEEVRPRLLVGFSDLTALHALFARAGLRSLHATMVAGLGRGTDAALAGWIAAAEGAVPAPLDGLTPIAPGRAEGPLAGGNLAVLAALCGTPYAPPLEGAVFFLEDVGEAPYRIDRMLTTLRQAGWLRRLAGVAVGQLTRATPGPDGRTVEEVLRDRLGDLGVPVVRGVPAGHDEDNRPLPLGAPVELDADAGTLTFREAAAVAHG